MYWLSWTWLWQWKSIQEDCMRLDVYTVHAVFAYMYICIHVHVVLVHFSVTNYIILCFPGSRISNCGCISFSMKSTIYARPPFMFILILWIELGMYSTNEACQILVRWFYRSFLHYPPTNRPVSIRSRLPSIPLFQLSRSQIIQLFCVFISRKLQLAGYLVKIIIPRYLRLVCKISRYLSGASSPALRLALYTVRERWAKYLELISWARVSSFKVKSRADEDAICNFTVISQIKNSGLFGNLKLMKLMRIGPMNRMSIDLHHRV